MKNSQICLFGVFLLACGYEPVDPVDPADLTPVQAFLQSPADLERGQALFIGSCAGYCHALEPDDREAVFLFDCEWIHGDRDEDLFTIITEGILETRMVGFGPNFPDGDADKYRIIAYLRANQESCS